MNFINFMPNDYYLTKIVNEFNDINNSNINYDEEIHKRNPIIKNKLTLNHLEFIEFFIRLVKPKNFMELGVQYGELTNKVISLIPEKYIGVDLSTNSNIDYLLKSKTNFEFYNKSTDDFFQDLKNNDVKLNLDMIFIDACHTHKASYNDFLNSIEHLNEDGFIFFHDTYPGSEYWIDEGLCSNCYLTPEIIRKNHNDIFEIITIPVNPGISIARKCSKQLKWL